MISFREDIFLRILTKSPYSENTDGMVKVLIPNFVFRR